MSEQLRAALASVVDGRTLSREEARRSMGAVMDGEATPAQLGAFLTALRIRGETVDELAGFATAMRARAIRVDAPDGAIDTCGTGGDGRGTFNISTAAALVVAAAGVPVAKHGNRAVTSASGSADVLEALGVPTDLGPEAAAAALREVRFAFLFAPGYQPAMRHAGPTRREIGIRTAFNLLGPITNPAGTRRQLVGVGDPAAAGRLAEVLHALGAERALVVHGDRIDELPLDGTGVAYDVSPAGVVRREIRPEDAGLPRAATEALLGGTPAENAARMEALFAGERSPIRDAVLLNAAAALLVAGRVDGLRAGVEAAAGILDRGDAAALLERLRHYRPGASIGVAGGGGPDAATQAAETQAAGGAR
ncbi:MAG: anthranilate phosphoribosyltransferase [Candidatus Limnocylindrales bacterium]